MPTYIYRCKACDTEFETVTTIARRKRSQRCDCGGVAVFQPIPYGLKGSIAPEKPVGDAKFIRDERQLEPGWRDKGTTGKPGGAGKKLYFH